MIVISRDLVLSEVDEVSTDNGVIGWHNIVTVNNIAASSAESGFPASELANPATHLRWRATAAADQTLTLSTNYVDAIDYLAVAGHNFGSAGIPLIVEHRDDPLGSYDTVLECVLPDDRPAILRFAPQSFESLRLTMLAGALPPEAAVIYVGKLLVLERSIKVDTDHIPINMAITTREVNGRSESGNFLGRIELNNYLESGADFDHFTPIWYRANFHPFIAARKPFFYAWNPAEYPYETGYVWMTNFPKPDVHPVTRRVGIELKYQGLFT